MNHGHSGHPDLSEEKLILLVIIHLFFTSLCNSTLISWDVEAEKNLRPCHSAVYPENPPEKIHTLIYLLQTLAKIKWSQKHMEHIDKCRLASKHLRSPCIQELNLCNLYYSCWNQSKKGHLFLLKSKMPITELGEKNIYYKSKCRIQSHNWYQVPAPPPGSFIKRRRE